jgi:hypothetical protein
MEEVPQIVDLNTLNVKAKAKEFKTTAKEIKSKEVAKRTFAIEKVKDERYFLEGGCLVPLIESMVPKKVSLEQINLSATQYFDMYGALENIGIDQNVIGVFTRLSRQDCRWKETQLSWSSTYT